MAQDSGSCRAVPIINMLNANYATAMRLYMAVHLVCAGVYSRIIAVGEAPCSTSGGRVNSLPARVEE